MVALVTYNNEEDTINEGERLITPLYIDFSDSPQRLNQLLVRGSGRDSNSSMFFIDAIVTCKNEEEVLEWSKQFMSSLPARMKIQLKVEGLERSKDFLHYITEGAVCCHGNQCSDPTWPKILSSQSLIQMMLQMNFDFECQLVSEIVMFKSVDKCTDASLSPILSADGKPLPHVS